MPSPDANKTKYDWDNLTWQDIQAIGAALNKDHAADNPVDVTADRLKEITEALPNFEAGATIPDDFVLSAIITAWIAVQEETEPS